MSAVAKTERRYGSFIRLGNLPVTNRPLTEVVCSGSFWNGFVNGFGPQSYLTHRYRYADLARFDTVGYAWNTVGNCLNEAIHDFAVDHEREGGIVVGECPESKGGLVVEKFHDSDHDLNHAIGGAIEPTRWTKAG